MMPFLTLFPTMAGNRSPLFAGGLVLAAMSWAGEAIAQSAGQEDGQKQTIGDVHNPSAAQGVAATTPPDTPLPTSGDEIAFSADTLNYDNENDIVTASGNVQMLREGNRLRADTVVWNRKTGAVEAHGNVSITDAEGNVAFGDRLDLTDTLKDGMVENLLLVMSQGGHLVAQHGSRKDGVYYLDRAAYSPCPVENSEGCPKEPTWQIKAVKVRYDPAGQRVSYRNARLELLGIPILAVPVLSHPVGDKGGSGLLIPDARINGINGLELSVPYYWRIAQNRELTLTPHVFSKQVPMLELAYRALLDKGAYRVTGFATSSSQTSSSNIPLSRQFRGYVDASGTFQLDPEWQLSGSLRAVTDRTFLRRYNISHDDRLRSTVEAQHISPNSYLSIAGWAVQTLRVNDRQGQMPVALPAIDYRLRLPQPILGGRLQLQANSLAISRTDGQDTQRAFVSAEWNMRRLTGLGQEVTFTAYARGDVYHSGDNLLNDVPAYSGLPGWRSRGIAAVAADIRWPFVGSFLGGTQRITPRFQIVASPHLANLTLPNEDSRTVDLDDSNLFALNRFPGYDRFEDSTRITYGVEYALSLKNFSLETVVGQSYRINRRPTLLPNGTGLSERMSDIVGRTTIRYKDFVGFTHRFRLDKDNLAIRRNEIDATVGSRRTYVIASYLKLNRNVTSQLEDLADREEVRLGARVAFTRYWSMFGSTVVDLTSKSEDPLSLADGFEPVRHRLGIAYQDNCFDFEVTWTRDYQSTGDARTNNTFQIRLAFRNLGK